MKTARDLVSRRREMSDRENDPDPGGRSRTGQEKSSRRQAALERVAVMDLKAGG